MTAPRRTAWSEGPRGCIRDNQVWQSVAGLQWASIHNYPLWCQRCRFVRFCLWISPDPEASALAWLFKDQEYQELRWRLIPAFGLQPCTLAGHKNSHSHYFCFIGTSWSLLRDAFTAYFIEKSGLVPLQQSWLLLNKPIIYFLLSPPLLFSFVSSEETFCSLPTIQASYCVLGSCSPLSHSRSLCQKLSASPPYLRPSCFFSPSSANKFCSLPSLSLFQSLPVILFLSTFHSQADYVFLLFLLN